MEELAGRHLHRNLTIPRSITSNPLQTLEFQVFSDASEKAYDAAANAKL